ASCFMLACRRSHCAASYRDCPWPLPPRLTFSRNGQLATLSDRCAAPARVRPLQLTERILPARLRQNRTTSVEIPRLPVKPRGLACRLRALMESSPRGRAAQSAGRLRRLVTVLLTAALTALLAPPASPAAITTFGSPL